MKDDSQFLVLDQLSFSFPGIPLFQKVNLRTSLKGLVQIVGPNGGGKSTLARLILGLLEPQSGSIRILGKSPMQARGRIGYVPQHSHYDPKFPVKVGEVVLSGTLRRPWGWYSRQDREACSRILESLELAHLAQRPFSALSGGQRQRVLVARALASEPDLLLLDEPTANVDVEAASTLENYIRKLKEDIGVLLITHDFDFLTASVDRVVCVNRNIHVHESGQLDNDELRKLFSGHFHALGEGA